LQNILRDWSFGIEKNERVQKTLTDFRIEQVCDKERFIYPGSRRNEITGIVNHDRFTEKVPHD
jgi:hypothetical protein